MKFTKQIIGTAKKVMIFYSLTNYFKLESGKIILLFLKHFPGCGTHAIAERYRNAAMTDKCLLIHMHKGVSSCYHCQEGYGQN